MGGVFGRAQDPWLQPFVTRFSIENEYAAVNIDSAGPDKQLGTADDFTALKVRRKWLAELESLVRFTLGKGIDYPASAEELLRLLEATGIRFEALRDPWGSAMRVGLAHSQRQRKIRIFSAGPDKAFDTADDFIVAEFGGTYFSGSEARIDRS